MIPLTKSDIDQLSTAVAERVLDVVATKKELVAVEERLTNKFSELQTSVDRYLKRTEVWHDEFNVLRARYDRLIHVLDQKGIVREEETHLA